jgi:predicted RNase H-like nuclease (RuvC/YqgF family)
MQTREMQIELKQKDKKIDTLKTQIAEKNERIERLRKQLQGTENQRLNDQIKSMNE